MSVGAWFHAHQPGLDSLADALSALQTAFPNGIDADLEALVTTALEATYPVASLPPLPPLQTGWERMLEHMRLLNGFQVPAPPADLPERVVAAVFGDPAAPYSQTLPDQTDLVESGGQPGVPGSGAGVQIQSAGDDGPTHQEEPDSTEVKCGAFWEALGLSVLFLLGGWFACVVRWADDDRCQLWDDMTQNWEAAFDNGVYVGAEPDTDFAAQALTTSGMNELAQRPELVQLVADLFVLQSTLWEGFQKAAEFLAVHGLTYPDASIGRWRYRQFTTVPSADEDWPRRTYSGSRFDLYPDSPAELPGEVPRFRAGATPAAILTGIGGGGQYSAPSVSIPVWLQVVAEELDADNLDLDSDRGWRHPCWATGGSIEDQPVAVVNLPYADT
jgi:hypothetical protein